MCSTGERSAAQHGAVQISTVKHNPSWCSFPHYCMLAIEGTCAHQSGSGTGDSPAVALTNQHADQLYDTRREGGH